MPVLLAMISLMTMSVVSWTDSVVWAAFFLWQEAQLTPMMSSSTNMIATAGLTNAACARLRFIPFPRFLNSRSLYHSIQGKLLPMGGGQILHSVYIPAAMG